MFNLLAMLLSLAMMLTGSTGGELAGPVGRQLLIDNITVEYDGQSLGLTPTVSIAARTDGVTSAFDFFIDKGGERLLPFQVVADAEKLLLLSDTAGTTLKLTQEELSQIAVEYSGDPQVFGMIQDMTNACNELWRIMNEPEQMLALQAEADRLYEEMVSRGEGTPEKVIYLGDTVELTSYEYNVDAATFGSLVEAIYSQNEALNRYGAAYLSLIAKAPEETGLSGVTSYAELFERMNLRMHVSENISADGLDIQDIVLTMSTAGAEAPMQLNIYAVRNGDHRESTVSTEYETGENRIEVYAESTQDGAELQGSMTMTVNRPGTAFEGEQDEGERSAEDAEASEEEAAEEEEEADEESPEGDEYDVDELAYMTFDFSFVPGELMNFEFNNDVADGSHYGFSTETTFGEGETTLTHVNLDMNVPDHETRLKFDAHTNADLFDLRASEEGAVSMQEFNSTALALALSGDVLKLTEDQDIQKAAEWLQGVQTEETPEEEEPEIEDEDLEEPEEATEEAPGEAPEAAPEAEPRQAPQEEPAYGEDFNLSDYRFTYLPEGFQVTDTYVDDTGTLASITVSNGEGRNIYISLSESVNRQSQHRVTYYDVGMDGAYAPINGLLVMQEINDDYIFYNADDGLVYYSVFPDSSDFPAEEILRIIGGIRFGA